jgi:hypothetical protein
MPPVSNWNVTTNLQDSANIILADPANPLASLSYRE